MRRFLSCLLCATLVLAQFSAVVLAEDALRLVIPDRISRIDSRLPQREEQPILRSKTQDGATFIRVSGEPDSVTANWLGYREVTEPVELENGLGLVEMEGHKYQLGAEWNKELYKDYYYDGEEISVYGKIKNVFEKGDLWYLIGFWVLDEDYGYVSWLYKGSDQPSDVEINLDLVLSSDYRFGEDILVTAHDTNHSGHRTGDYITMDYASWDEDAQVWYRAASFDTLRSLNEKYEATNATYYANSYYIDENGEAQQLVIGHSREFLPMVREGALEIDAYGTESNGAPNQAWTLTKGDWTAIYTRAGKLIQITKTETKTDYFATGVAENSGKVIWALSETEAGPRWFVSEITENYAEGDIASATAQYNVRGDLVKYWLTWRTGDNERYTIRYTADDRPAYGTYSAQISKTETHKAKTASRNKWVDTKTGQLTDSVELDWSLVPLMDWKNPPRVKK